MEADPGDGLDWIWYQSIELVEFYVAQVLS